MIYPKTVCCSIMAYYLIALADRIPQQIAKYSQPCITVCRLQHQFIKQCKKCCWYKLHIERKWVSKRTKTIWLCCYSVAYWPRSPAVSFVQRVYTVEWKVPYQPDVHLSLHVCRLSNLVAPEETTSRSNSFGQNEDQSLEHVLQYVSFTAVELIIQSSVKNVILGSNNGNVVLHSLEVIGKTGHLQAKLHDKLSFRFMTLIYCAAISIQTTLWYS